MKLLAIEFKNFRSIREARFELSDLTILAGANGSGKNSVLTALRAVRSVTTGGQAENWHCWEAFRTIDAEPNEIVQVSLEFDTGQTIRCQWSKSHPNGVLEKGRGIEHQPEFLRPALAYVKDLRVFNFTQAALASPSKLTPNPQLGDRGHGLAALLDSLRDSSPEIFQEFSRNLPEIVPGYTAILFETTVESERNLILRRSDGKDVQARFLSEGSLILLATLALCLSSDESQFLAFRDPSRFLYPSSAKVFSQLLVNNLQGQTLITTHSPDFLNRFSDSKCSVQFAVLRDFETGFISPNEGLDDPMGGEWGDEWLTY